MIDPSTVRACTLTRAECVARDVWMYDLTPDAPLSFLPGQWVNLTVPTPDGHVERSYSVWSDPVDPTVLRFAIKLFEGGAASEYLRAAKVGDRMTLRGPFGVFTLADDPGPHWFFATSTGLAPFHSMLCAAASARDPRPFRLYFGVRDQGDVFGLDALEGLRAALPDFRYTVSLSRPEPGWTGHVGRITQRLPEEHAAPRGVYYLCGNTAMVDEARAFLRGAGLDRKRVKSEKYY